MKGCAPRLVLKQRKEQLGNELIKYIKLIEDESEHSLAYKSRENGENASGESVCSCMFSVETTYSDVYSCFEKGCPTKARRLYAGAFFRPAQKWTKAYATMWKGMMMVIFNSCLIEAQGFLAWQKETAETKCIWCIHASCWNTVNLNQATPNYYYP